MGADAVVSKVERVKALDAPADVLQGLVGKLIPAGPVRDALTGRWLGHPVHPMLTDLPIGFWTSSMVFDLIPLKQARWPADLMIALGVATAVPTAAAGAADWMDTVDRPRRAGLVHAAANSAALGLYVWSLAARARGRRGKGVALAMAGGAAATVGGYLGGHLVAAGIGVDNTAFEPAVEDWTAVGAVEEFADRVPRRVDAGGAPVVVVREGATFRALGATCTHRGGPLDEGDVTGEGGDTCLSCPWHGSVFALSNGGIRRGPASVRQPAYEVQVAGGTVSVRRKERA